jgi:hypothetical protein
MLLYHLIGFPSGQFPVFLQKFYVWFDNPSNTRNPEIPSETSSILRFISYRSK